MTSVADVAPMIIGTPTDSIEGLILYMFAGAIGTICIMFFLKLFLLIGGFMSPKLR